jgi:uncharacterized FlaG/YvyC family protein
LRFDEATERIVAQVLNKENQVVKQIPPEELLRILSRLRNLVGLLFDHSA